MVQRLKKKKEQKDIQKEKEKVIFDLYGCHGNECNGECLNMDCEVKTKPISLKNKKSISLYRDDVSFFLRLKISFLTFLSKIFKA